MFSVVELMLISGQKVELCAGDQITIGEVGEDYKGRWCCLSKTSNSSDIRRFLIGAPDEALVSVGRNRVSFKRSDIFSIKDIEQSDLN
jgi:hypothetical protein